MSDLKPIAFRGSALDNLSTFPISARREAGYRLDRVRHGLASDDWSPMTTVGPWVREIRIRGVPVAFRIICVAKLADAFYALHCFQKKTRKTGKADRALAKNRYRELIRELNQ